MQWSTFSYGEWVNSPSFHLMVYEIHFKIKLEKISSWKSLMCAIYLIMHHIACISVVVGKKKIWKWFKIFILWRHWFCIYRLYIHFKVCVFVRSSVPIYVLCCIYTVYTHNTLSLTHTYTHSELLTLLPAANSTYSHCKCLPNWRIEFHVNLKFQ